MKNNMNNNLEIMDMIVSEIQEKSRMNNLRFAYEIYKTKKEEIIQNLLSSIEQEIINAMMNGYASISVKLSKMEFTHNETLTSYFRSKGFKSFCDKFYDEEGVEYLLYVEWASEELNLQ